MKKTKIKRVFLIADESSRAFVLAQDFLASIPDKAILDSLYTIGRDVWIGETLYHIIRQDGMVRRMRYEIVTLKF